MKEIQSTPLTHLFSMALNITVSHMKNQNSSMLVCMALYTEKDLVNN